MSFSLGTVRRLFPEPIRQHLPAKKKSWLGGLLFDVLVRKYRIGDLTFEVPRDLTPRSFRSRFLFRTYESQEIGIVQEAIKPGMKVLELGACLGILSSVTNRQLGRSDEHVVVEANPQLLGWIAKNRDANRLHFQVEHGLVSRSSDGTFYLHELVVGGSGDRATGTAIQVPVTTIEQLEEKYGFRFDVLIMDIEGGEVAFVRENPEFLSRLKLALVEIHDWLSADEREQVRQALRDAGLKCAKQDGLSDLWVRERTGGSK